MRIERKGEIDNYWHNDNTRVEEFERAILERSLFRFEIRKKSFDSVKYHFNC